MIQATFFGCEGVFGNVIIVKGRFWGIYFAVSSGWLWEDEFFEREDKFKDDFMDIFKKNLGV